jgi:CheY-like chemotaxis protein
MTPGGVTEGERASGTILVVDDDADQRSCLAELLSRAGYDVAFATDGLDALELLGGGLRPVLIVLDLTMPRMDGRSFLERLRVSARSTIPVLVTSAALTQPPPAGADECLEKPLDARAFREAVARLSADPGGARP